MSIKEETETDKILLYVAFTPQKTSDIRLVCLAMFPLRLPQPIFGDLDMETHQLEGTVQLIVGTN